MRILLTLLVLAILFPTRATLAAESTAVTQQPYPYGYSNPYGQEKEVRITDKDAEGNVTTVTTDRDRNGDWETRRTTTDPEGNTTSETIVEGEYDSRGNLEIERTVTNPGQASAGTPETTTPESASKPPALSRPTVYIDKSDKAGDTVIYQRDGKTFISRHNQKAGIPPRNFGGANDPDR